MKSSNHDPQSGQALIQVALAMVALLAFVALAIDAGNLYAQRRQMQNAADAGALAGAWELCFGNPAQAQTTALNYTIDRNQAQTATANIIGGWQVDVTARTVVNTYLAGIIGIDNVPVEANAMAACSGSRNLCDVWPITFNQFRFQNIPCDVQFYVWNDDSLEGEDLEVQFSDGTTGIMPVCDRGLVGDPGYVPGLCDCAVAFGAPDGNSYLIGPGHRGWVSFPRPVAPYSADAACTNNCGSNQSVCIINGGYQAPIEIPPGGTCLPGQPGVANSVVHAIDNNLGQQVNLLLWDRACTSSEPVQGTCPGTPYHITGTGCFTALGTPTVDLPKKTVYSDVQILTSGWLRNNVMCQRNIKTVLARKDCDCGSACGSTIGTGPPQTGEVRSVSLIQ